MLTFPSKYYIFTTGFMQEVTQTQWKHEIVKMELSYTRSHCVVGNKLLLIYRSLNNHRQNHPMVCGQVTLLALGSTQHSLLAQSLVASIPLPLTIGKSVVVSVFPSPMYQSVDCTPVVSTVATKVTLSPLKLKVYNIMLLIQLRQTTSAQLTALAQQHKVNNTCLIQVFMCNLTPVLERMYIPRSKSEVQK